MQTPPLLVTLALVLSAASPSLGAPSAAEAQKPIKTLINSIRYGKFDLAAKQLAFAEMTKRMLDIDASKFSDAEHKEFAQSVETIIRADSFSKSKDKFQYLDNVLYEAPRDKGTDVLCKSTIVIHHELKKTELVVDWVLIKDAGAYKIVDMIVLGDSTIAGVREDQVQPMLKEGGPAKVMAVLREKVAELAKK